MRYSIISLLFLIYFAGAAQSQKADLIRIMAAPVSDSYEVAINERADFNVAIYKYGKIVKNASITYTIAPEQMDAKITKSIVLKDGQGLLEGIKLSEPGFIRLTVSYKDGETVYENTATAGVALKDLKTYTVLPTDFDAFWTRAIEDARKIPLEPLLTRMPEKDTPTKHAYHVRFNHGNKSFIYGILTVPNAPGKYPAILHVPGAGVRPYEGTDYNDQIISLQMGIHGIPVNLYDSDIYENLRNGALYKYYNNRMDDRNRYYFKRVYTACVRAIDFIHTLQEFDGENIGVTGGSQGGALTIVTAALDSRVDAIAAYYPALSDLEGYKHNRAGGWPRFDGKGLEYSEQLLKVGRYYDVVNFARKLKIPGYYGYGYNDDVCPATSITAMLNEIKAKKQVVIAYDVAHWMYPEIKEQGKNWLYNYLQVSGYETKN